MLCYIFATFLVYFKNIIFVQENVHFKIDTFSIAVKNCDFIEWESALSSWLINNIPSQKQVKFEVNPQIFNKTEISENFHFFERKKRCTSMLENLSNKN